MDLDIQTETNYAVENFDGDDMYEEQDDIQDIGDNQVENEDEEYYDSLKDFDSSTVEGNQYSVVDIEDPSDETFKKMYQCSLCSITCATAQSVRRHLRRCHNSEQP